MSSDFCLDNLEISRIQVMGEKKFLSCDAVSWSLLRYCYQILPNVNQNHKITNWHAGMLANADQKGCIIFPVVTINSLLSAVSSWRHSFRVLWLAQGCTDIFWIRTLQNNCVLHSKSQSRRCQIWKERNFSLLLLCYENLHIWTGDSHKLCPQGDRMQN